MCIGVAALIAVLAATYLLMPRIPEELTAPPASATSVPEPTAPPEPVIVAISAPNTDAAFAASIRSLSGIRAVDTEAAVLPELTGLAAAVVYVSTVAEAEAINRTVETGLPVVAYNACGAELKDAVIEVRYAVTAPSDAQQALDAAIAYPPHDTPVRLFGVFETADGEAARIWNEQIANGRVLSKGTYGLTEEKKSLEEWFSAKLKAYYPGMVDAIFVETPTLAVQLAEWMLVAERDDFEIFTVGTDAALLQAMREHPRLLPSVVETDDALAAKHCAQLLSQLLTGAAPQDVVLEPDAN